MRRFLTLSLSVLLLLVVLAPQACVADEEEDDKPQPAPVEEPAPDANPEGEEEADDEDGDSEEPAGGQPAAPVAKVDPPVGPGGMVYVPGGPGPMGTRSGVVFKLTKGRDPLTVQWFFFETPQHTPTADGYWIDRYEVTNAQYLAFLQATAAVVYDTSSGALGNLDAITANLLKMSPKEQKDEFLGYWRQLYEANKDALWKALEKQLPELKVMRPDGTLDEDKTAQKFRFQKLPRNLKLDFYTRRPPYDWPGIKPLAGKENHPVRDVSYLDASRFAEWAGKHIPSEPEYERATRGPEGYRFAWGNGFPMDKQAQMKLGNFYTNFVDEHYMASTVAVDDIPGSASWCGAMHLTGNVAEWTSSWFKKYPGYNKKSAHDKWLGRTNKVIRGGHGDTREMLVLRAAARNFSAGPDSPNYPGNRYEWVGFRCAWYPKAGQNHLEPIIERARRARRVDTSQLALDRFMGAVTEQFAEPGAFDENHAYILGPSNAVVIIPIKQVLWPTGDAWAEESWKKAKRFRKTKDFVKRSTQTEDPRIILGVLHTDVGFDKVFVRKPLEPGEKVKTAKGRGRKRAPETIEGKSAPGTYLLTLWHGRLALASPSLEFECFLTPPNKKGETPVEVVKIDPKDLPDNQFELDALADEGGFTFHVGLGGNKTDEDVFVKASAPMHFILGELDERGEWRQGGGEDLPTAAQTNLPAFKPMNSDVPEPVMPDPEDDEEGETPVNGPVVVPDDGDEKKEEQGGGDDDDAKKDDTKKDDGTK